MKHNYFGDSMKLGWALLSAVFAVAIIWTVSQAMATSASPQTDRLVSIYDRGEERAIVTKAATVADALRDAKITVDPADIVEPALTEKLVAKNYHINVYRARPVVVTDGTARLRVMTAEQSPQQIAQAAKLTLQDEDITAVQRVDDVISEGGAGLKLVIDRATPFTFVLYGKKFQAYSQQATVGEMLNEKGVKLAAQDGTSVPLATPLVAGMTVEVWRNGVQTITQEEEVPMPIRHVQNADQPVGFKQLQAPGKPGKKQVTYELNLQNGQEVSRRIIQSVVSAQPVEQVEIVGSKPVFNGNFAEALARLRQCESGGRYDRNSGNGYYGAYQYDISTWANWGGYARADLAPPAVQDEKVWETYKRRGWQPWPSCKVKMDLQDIYR